MNWFSCFAIAGAIMSCFSCCPYPQGDKAQPRSPVQADTLRMAGGPSTERCPNPPCHGSGGSGSGGAQSCADVPRGPGFDGLFTLDNATYNNQGDIPGGCRPPTPDDIDRCVRGCGGTEDCLDVCSSTLVCGPGGERRLPDGDRLVVGSAEKKIDMATFGIHAKEGMWWKGLCIVNRGEDASRWYDDFCISAENGHWSKVQHAIMPGDPSHGIACKDIVLWKAKEFGIHKARYLVTMNRVINSNGHVVTFDWLKD